jgi:hypothetical protein
MKRALHRGGDNTLNVYLNTASVNLGWASRGTVEF